MLGLILYILAAAGLAGTLLILSRLFGPRRTSSVKQMPFECGNRPHKVVRGKVSVQFFLVALLFILFDVELIFLFPWAVVFRSLGVEGLGAMAAFLAFVIAGLVYVWKEGALQWQ